MTAACLAALAIWYAIDSRSVREALAHVKSFVSPLLYTQISHVPHGWSRVPQAQPKAQAPRAARAEAAAGGELSLPADAKLPAESPAVATETQRPAADAIATLPAPQADLPATETVRADLPQPPASIPTPAEPGQAQLTQARKFLSADGSAANPTKAVALLWEAVEKGNSAAAVELASLYLSGRWVVKSCEQALVLLTAAQNRERAVVEEKLRSFPQNGCAVPSDWSNPPPAPDAVQ